MSQVSNHLVDGDGPELSVEVAYEFSLDEVADVKVARRRDPCIVVLPLATYLAISDKCVAVFVRDIDVGQLRTDVHG